MPRRHALSEKKRERLMQEHERLQKLMLQARSTVRRSSLQPRTSDEEHEEIESRSDVPDLAQRETNDNEISNSSSESTAAQNNTANEVGRTLTESDLFPQQQSAPSNLAIHVVLPQEESREEVEMQSASARITEPEEAPVAEAEIPPETEIEPNDAEDSFLIDEPRKKNTVLKYILILPGALLLGFGAYWFYVQSGSKQQPVTAEKTRPTSNVTPTSQPAPVDSASSSKDTTSTGTNTAATENASRKKQEGSPATIAAEQNTSKENPAPELGRYKVISKAYFHNEPDESTRRNAFIVHWNNAVLTPTEEKRGFVYVVFTNHLGQTSKGWLRKKDLQRIQ